MDGRDRTQPRSVAAAKEDLLEGAVGRPVLGEYEHRDAGDVGSGVGPQHGAAVAGQVPGQTQAGLKVVEVIRNPAIGREQRIVQIGSEEGVGRLDEHIRVPGAVPAQPQVEGHPFVRLPGILNEQAQLVHRELLEPELLRRDARDRRRLQVEQDRPGDGGAARTHPGQAGRPVRASDVMAAVGDEADEALHRIEQVAAVGHPDELLADAGPVVLHPGLDQVRAGREGEIVHQLKARVERRIDRQEEGQPDAEAVVEVHGDVGKGPAAQLGELGWAGQARAGEQRSPVPARPVLARPLQAQLVGKGVAQQRAQTGVDSVGAIPLDPVGRGAPGIDVEGAVHLLRPGVVVLDRGLLSAAQVQIELGQQRARIVGAPDRPEFVVEQSRPACLQKALQALQVGRIADSAGRLLGLGGRLLVVGQEEERPVPNERPAQCPAHLIAVKVGPPAAARFRKRGGDLIPLPEVVGGAGQPVGARLGDHVDEAA